MDKFVLLFACVEVLRVSLRAQKKDMAIAEHILFLLC